jgi:5'-3' exonuclease
MILIDLSQTIIAVASANYTKGLKEDIFPLWRAQVLTTLLSYKKKHHSKYGNPVLAVDHRGGKKSWRKQKYSWYKGHRTANRDKDKERWDLIFAFAEKMTNECMDYLPWKVVSVEEAEADDVIAVISREMARHEQMLIVSSDSDYLQLQENVAIKQWCPRTKKMLSPAISPKHSLMEKIFYGDSSDGIPNVLSVSNSIIDKIRQKSTSEAKFAEFVQYPDLANTKYGERIKENTELISFDYIPAQIQGAILDRYLSAEVKSIKPLYNFLVQERASRLLANVQDFRIKPEDYPNEAIKSEGFFFE